MRYFCAVERGAAIILIGFMGSGKSSVGRRLAASTGLERFDTDEMVSARAGRPIAEIFAEEGEAEFRKLEMEAVRQLPRHAAIIVTGGGVVLRTENVEALRQLGLLVSLTGAEGVLFERASRSQRRPLLRTADPRATFAALLRQREALYREAADFAIDTTKMQHDEVASSILEKIEALRAQPSDCDDRDRS